MLRYILVGALVLVSIVLIVVVLVQPGKSDGLNFVSGGTTTDTFFAKNKSRTYEAFLKKITVVCSVIGAGLVIALNLLK